MSELVPVAAPRPDTATLAAVRRTLGARVPPGEVRTAVPVDRVDLLGRYLHPDVAALVVLWLGGTRRASTDTRVAYCDDIIGWAAWERRELGRLFALDLQRAEVTMWLTHQQDAGFQPSSIARRLSALSSLYKYAQSWGLPVVSPISDDDHRPRLDRGRKATSARVLDAIEVAAMIAAAETDLDVIVVGVLFTDTIRVSELCNADRDSVDDDGIAGCWLRITRKGGKTTRVPLDLIVCRRLDAYNQTRENWNGDGPEPLLLNRRGKRLTRKDVTRVVQRLARLAGIPRPYDVTPHSMRASSITDQIKRGVAPQHVQDLSGHADLRTLMIYVEEQGKTERVRKMAADLGRVLRGSNKP
jgi:integrase/recombinase XerD